MPRHLPSYYRHELTFKHEKKLLKQDKELWDFLSDEMDDPNHDVAPAPQSPEDAGIALPTTAPLTSSAGIPESAPPAPQSIARSASSGKNPWAIRPPLDACRFFGPLLSLIVAGQICASILISRQLEGSITEMTSTAVATIIMAAFLLTDASLLVYLRGCHFKKFTPWLAGLLLVSVCICIGLAAWNSHTGVRTPPVAATSPNAALADAVTGSVNSYRLTHGASELKRHAGLDLLARNHSNYMRANRGKFTPNETNATHLGFEGRAMVARRHYYFTNSTETVAAVAKSTSDARSASKLLTLWKESPQDEKAMTNKDWTHTGIGTVTDSDGTVFATQIYGTENLFHGARRERFN